MGLGCGAGRILLELVAGGPRTGIARCLSGRDVEPRCTCGRTVLVVKGRKNYPPCPLIVQMVPLYVQPWRPTTHFGSLEDPFKMPRPARSKSSGLLDSNTVQTPTDVKRRNQPHSFADPPSTLAFTCSLVLTISPSLSRLNTPPNTAVRPLALTIYTNHRSRQQHPAGPDQTRPGSLTSLSNTTPRSPTLTGRKTDTPQTLRHAQRAPEPAPRDRQQRPPGPVLVRERLRRPARRPGHVAVLRQRGQADRDLATRRGGDGEVLREEAGEVCRVYLGVGVSWLEVGGWWWGAEAAELGDGCGAIGWRCRECDDSGGCF